VIFEDPSRRRWRLAVFVFVLLAILGMGATSLFVMSLLDNPPLPSIVSQELTKRAVLGVKKTIEQTMATEQQNSSSLPHRRSLTSTASGSGSLFHSLPHAGETYTTAFLVQEDQDSITSFKEHRDALDVVFPDWYFLTHSTCSVEERIEPSVRTLLHETNISILPRFTNGDDSGWHEKEIRALFTE
jgi:hypothetical protein